MEIVALVRGEALKTKLKQLPFSCTECLHRDKYGCVGDVYCKFLQDYFTGNVAPPYKERPDVCPLRVKITQQEYDSVHSDYKGEWMNYHGDHPEWLGKRTVMEAVFFNQSCGKGVKGLLIEGVDLIVEG